MTKTIVERLPLAAAIVILAKAAALGALVAPESSRGRQVEYEAVEGFFGRVKSLEPLAEATERWQYDRQRLYRELMLGSYARVERHLKVGAFYRLQYGARHDDDWLRDAQGNWSWRDTTRRPEHVLVLDATPRTELSFMPGKNWTGSLKVRGEHDFFNGQNVLRAAPELAWFWMEGLRPRATVFLRYETVFPLNFGQTTVWERWWYLAGLWHARPWLSLGPQAALRDEVWSTSSGFKSFGGPDSRYQTLYRAWILGATLVARLP